MDRINKGTFDQMMEDAIRCEPQVELPVDFRRLFLDQIKVQEKPKFQIFSWVEVFSSFIIAITVGTAFLIPALLPEQLSPLMQWYIQWGGYLLTKAVYFLPSIILTGAGILLAIGLLIVGGKAMLLILKNVKERKNAPLLL
ncbi:MAG TPA: hypothetical protein VK856_15760 [Anaerolineaceae bacterium]|nr:hypothetical protein [Anaerolineaceae bacterium]